MENLISLVRKLHDSDIADIINNRIEDFKDIGRNEESIFLELCFCLLTANFQAQKSWDIQKKFKKELLYSSEDDLKNILKSEGHRFWPQRANRIVLARDKREELIKKLDDEDIRDWIVKNIKGLGMKEASHFLRNIGYLNYAIIDFHIIDLLVNQNIIERPKTLTSKRYIEIEKILKKMARMLSLSLGELDLYLWYLETGNVLK